MATKISRKSIKRLLQATSFELAAVFIVGMGLSPMATAASAGGQVQQQYFASAAQEFGVPENVLLAVSYNESHWEFSPGVSNDGGYGIMDLRAYTPTVVSGRDGKIVKNPNSISSDYNTLNKATQLLHVSMNTLKTDQRQNVRGGAAVLAQEARDLSDGRLPTNANDWYSAVAKYSGANNTGDASTFADSVFNTIKTGATSTSGDNQSVNLPAAHDVQPNTHGLSALHLTPMSVLPPTGTKAECPKTLSCRFVPAAYAQDDPNDPTNYGNYDPANRPKDMQIRYIFIHDGEGTYDSIINHFQDPTAYDSAQYVISSQGNITQMVKNEDVSWGVANWNLNMHGINIEHEGFAAQGAQWYTPAMYQASATLVRWLSNKYHIPVDRQHILGHDNIMHGPAAGQASQHWDPGPYWNWTYYMDLVKGKTPQQAAADYVRSSSDLMRAPVRKGDVVTIAPNFKTNQPIITDCQTGSCITLPRQGASFVYLHTQPSDTAPLLSDPYLHPDGSAGTTVDSDWGDKAPSGFKFVVAGVHGNWTAIWYAGQKAWFYNPAGPDRTAHKSWNATMRPRPGLSSIPVYTNAYPEASAYPSDIPAQPQGTAYSIPAGQKYAVDDESVGSDYFYDETVNYSLPDDHAIVVGNQRYYEINFNHRIGYVKVGDVVISH